MKSALVFGLMVVVASFALTSGGRVNDPCICTFIYAPVCGSDGVTYSNACVAKCHGVVKYRDGPCSYAESE